MARKFEEADRQRIFAAVFEGMSEGKTVAQVAEDWGVSAGTVRKWIADDEDAYAEYQRMRPMLGVALAEEAIKLARGATYQTTNADRLRVDTLKWASAKYFPSEFGDKQAIEHSGSQTLKISVVEENVPIASLAGALPPTIVATAVLSAVVESQVAGEVGG